MEFSDLLRNPSAWTVAAFVLYVLYKEWPRIVSIFQKRADLSVARDEADIHFDAQARRKLLENEDFSRELVNRMLAMLETERHERRVAVGDVVEQAKTGQMLATQAVAVMQDFVEIARTMVQQQNGQVQHVARTLDAVGFVLARLYFVERRDVSWADLQAEMEKHGGNQGPSATG